MAEINGAPPVRADDAGVRGGWPGVFREGLSTTQVVFLASLVAMDFAFGFVIKNLMHSTGISHFIHVEMVVPAMLIMLAAQALDRFGVIILYQGAWAVLATVALPGAIVPGPFKIPPALLQGLLYDVLFRALRGRGRARVYLTAIIGGMVSSGLFMATRVLLGLPWAPATKLLFASQLASSVLVYGFGAHLSIKVWERARQTPLAHFIGAGK